MPTKADAEWVQLYTQGIWVAESPEGLDLRKEDTAVPGFATVHDVLVILS